MQRVRLYAKDCEMLCNASAINGYAKAASHGKFGNISDFIFDGTNWIMRWRRYRELAVQT